MKETESKYDAPAGASLPALDDLPRVARVAPQSEESLEAEYYDTSGLRLIRAGITLRRRQGGHDDGWHLKVPESTGSSRKNGRGGASGGAGRERREIRVPVGQRGGEVPSELAVMVRVHTRGEPLKLVARMTTKRRRVILLSQSGESLAEIAADEVSAQSMGDSTTLSRWHEVEVELTGGDRQLLKAAGKRLRRAGLTPAGRSAKLERALSQEPAGPVGQPELTRSASAGEVVLSYLRAQVEALKALDPKVRNGDPDSIHQMRVTTRRLRSTLRTFGKVIDRSSTNGVDGELNWLGTMLGTARDAEVLAEHLRAALRRIPVEQNVGPVEARIRAHFAPVAAAARAEVLAALDSQRYFSLLDSLDKLVSDPPFTAAAAKPARKVLSEAVRRAYRQTKRRMRQAWRAPAGQPRDEALHRARKAAKRARYAGEAVIPVLGRRAVTFTNRIKKVQSVLGEHQDTVIARQAVRELGMSAHLGGENSYTYGLLHSRETRAAEEIQRRARKAWRRTGTLRR